MHCDNWRLEKTDFAFEITFCSGHSKKHELLIRAILSKIYPSH